MTTNDERKPQVIDFVDYNGWGHALHANTWSAIEHPKLAVRLMDKIKERRRYSFMVHSSKYPRIGDVVRYKTAQGIRNSEIWHVKPCRDPHDMFTLSIVVTEKP